MSRRATKKSRSLVCGQSSRFFKGKKDSGRLREPWAETFQIIISHSSAKEIRVDLCILAGVVNTRALQIYLQNIVRTLLHSTSYQEIHMHIRVKSESSSSVVYIQAASSTRDSTSREEIGEASYVITSLPLPSLVYWLGVVLRRGKQSPTATAPNYIFVATAVAIVSDCASLHYFVNHQSSHHHRHRVGLPVEKRDGNARCFG